MAKFKCNQILQIEPCDYIEVSPNDSRQLQIAFITKHNDSNEQKRQGRLIIANFPNIIQPILDQSFQRAHELKLEWSPDCILFSSSRKNPNPDKWLHRRDRKILLWKEFPLSFLFKVEGIQVDSYLRRSDS